ncbi:MAG: hypothetical protein B6U94_06605 [Thermofilum sp. ex4484_79]|nr:MAG: hypothetical protein B6U94_06605 [Thermofilum sp. ex4484_79]
MKRKSMSIFISIAILIPLLLYSLPSLEASIGEEYCHMRVFVNENGSATVQIIFVAKGTGVGENFIQVPLDYRKEVLEGELIKWNVEQSYNPFYYNISFKYRANGVFKLNISFFFEHASLLVKREAWFMSPSVVIGRGDYYISIKMDYDKITDEIAYVYGYGYMDLVKLDKNASGLHYKFPSPRIGGRVIIVYETSAQTPETEVVEPINEETIVKVLTPIYYVNFSRKIIDIYRRAYPRLVEIFNVTLPWINVTLFLPKRFPETYGYVMAADIGEGIPTVVHLNLALIRYVSGMLEHTAIHELVHVMLGRVGVSATSNTRWFHEGVAEYVGMTVAIEIGDKNVKGNITANMQARISQVESLDSSNFGIVQNWDQLLDKGYGYLISFYIIYKLASKYGGLDFIRRFAVYAKQETSSGTRIETTSKVVELLSKAAGEDLVDTFVSWGFKLSPTLLHRGDTMYVYLIIAGVIVLVFTVLAFVLFFLKSLEAKKVPEEELPPNVIKCKYCGAILPKGYTVCPFCGREIEENVIPPSQ